MFANSGRVCRCVPIPLVIMIIGGVTGLIEFIFYVLSWICQEPDYILTSLTWKFVNSTYNEMHYLMIAANFLLLATLCVKMASLFVPYVLCAIAIALWSLTQDVATIKFLVESSQSMAKAAETIKEIKSSMGTNGIKTPDIKTSMETNDLMVNIAIILWNLFISALYLAFGSLAIMCGKKMSLNENAATMDLPIRFKGQNSPAVTMAPSNPTPN